jgi:hypothetical protein
MKIVGIIFGLLTALCVYNAIDDWRAAMTMRRYPAQVVAAKLKVDYGVPDSESQEQPLYTLVVDFMATDESKRSFHWEGEPGSAVYPEEAFDELARFTPGTLQEIFVLRGNARALRFDSLEENLEVSKAIAWTSCSVLFAIVTWAVFASRRLGNRGPWAAFVAIGMLPLLGVLPVGWMAYQKLTTWVYVSGKPIGELSAFDPLQALPNVEFTAKALEKLPATRYHRFEFVWNGKVLHGGFGGWLGPYDVNFGQESPRFYVSPKDRWATAGSLEWGEDFGMPVGILLLFGLAFTGAGLLIRRMKL